MVTPVLDGVVWSAIHNGLPVLIFVGLPIILILLAAAFFTARTIFFWILEDQNAPTRYQKDGVKVLLVPLICMLSVVGYIEIVIDLMHRPPRIQDNLVLANQHRHGVRQ